jgi:hypothetical protein
MSAFVANPDIQFVSLVGTRKITYDSDSGATRLTGGHVSNKAYHIPEMYQGICLLGFLSSIAERIDLVHVHG